MNRPSAIQKVWLCVGIFVISTWGQPVLAAPRDDARIMEGHVDATDSVAANQNEIMSRLEKGVQDFAKNDYKKAQKDFQSALVLDPSNADALYNLGALAERRGALQEALNYYQLASRANPSDMTISTALAAVAQKTVAQGQATASGGSKLTGVAHATGSAFAAGLRAFATGWNAVPTRPVDTCGVCAPVLGRGW